MSCKKVEKGKKLRSVDMKREISLRVLMGCSTENSFSCSHAARSSTGCPVPQPVEELEHRRRGWVHCVCSAMTREGYRETYPLPATAWWEGTQTVLKGTQRGRGASTRAATWDITALYGGENILSSGKWITETEVQRVFILEDNEKCSVHGLEQPDQMGFRLVSRMD